MHIKIPAVLSLGLFVFGCATTEKPASGQAPAVAAEKPVLHPIENPFPPNPPGIYDVSKVTVAPTPRVQALPRYPVELRRAGIGGEGVVSFIVDTDGAVRNASIIRATDIRFGEAAREAVQKWKFRPAQLNGSVVGCHMIVPIIFAVNAE